MPETPAYRTLGLTVPIAEVLDPQRWRDRYAHGIVLGEGEPTEQQDSIDKILGCKGSRGKAKTLAGREAAAAQELIDAVAKTLPEDTIRWHIKVALSELETRLGIPMGIVVRKSTPVDTGLVQGVDYDQEIPRLPFTRFNQQRFFRIDLPAGVISVERVRAYWYGQRVLSISTADGNKDLIQFEHPGISSLHILPTNATTLLISTAGWGSWQMIYALEGDLPHVWGVDYTLGPKARYGTVGDIELVLAHWALCKASITLLSIGGMAASRGLSSSSLSFDGISKSVSLQASAMYGINSALENRFKEATEAIDWKALKTYKKGLRVVPYGA